MNLGAVLVTGLFAGGISCAAVQGGLLTGLVTRQRGLSPAKAISQPVATAADAAAPAMAAVATARRPPPSGKASAKKAQAARRKATQPTQQQRRARSVEPPTPLRLRALAGLRTLRTQSADDLAPVGAFWAASWSRTRCSGRCSARSAPWSNYRCRYGCGRSWPPAR